MTDDEDNAENTLITWNGIEIEIRYEQNWLSTGFDHLEVESLNPKRQPLPITETGYAGRFLRSETIEALGGPVSLVRGWLDEAATKPEWLACQAAQRQLTLF